MNSIIIETVEFFHGFTPAEKLDAAYIESWRGRIPHSMLEFWSKYGLGSLSHGSFWFCKPEDYSEILTLLIGADKDFNARESHVYGRTAFGRLFVWNEKYQSLYIDLLSLEFAPIAYLYPERRGDYDRDIWINISTASSDRLFDTYDTNGKQLYKRAVKKLGPLAPNECFGFFPALAIGGEPKLENLQKVDAQVHFSILAQLDKPKLMDYKPWPPKFVRYIG